MQVVPGIKESHYVPISKFEKMHDCRMASVVQDKHNGTLYYEYTTNEVKVKNLANSTPSICKDNNFYHSQKVYSSQPRLHAYDYQLYHDQQYIPLKEHVYDTLRADYPYLYSDFIDPKLFYDKDFSRRSKSRSSKNSTRSRSKSTDRKRKKLPQCDNFSLGGIERGNSICRSLSRNGNFIAPAYDINPYDLLASYHSYPAVECPPPRDFTFSNHGSGHQRPSREVYRHVQTFCPSSPLDSGLSSQSVASSPSFEGESMQIRRIPECGSPVPLAALQKNQCSCSTNSCTDSSILSPPIRSDSGRSSPWTQSAYLRLNALAEAKKSDVPHSLSTLTNTVSLSTHDFDQKRYSMSGIYVGPRDKNCNHILPTQSDVMKNLRMKPLDTSSYEYLSEQDFRNIAITSPGNCIHRQKADHIKHLQNDSELMSDSNIDGHPTSLCHEKSDKILEPESSMSLTNSNSPTSLSSATGNKSDNEHRKLNQNSEKAICELEEMYNKLNLQDYDLLDRAERRDLPTPHQVNNSELPSIMRSKSDSFYEILGQKYCNPFKKPQRAPPLRRSGVPDLIADDMAMRKLQKPVSKPYQANENASSYMLYSPHFTPSLPAANDVWLTNRPNIDYDDFSFRRYFHLSSGKLEEPQPPFGIPLNPNPPQSVFSDYLHIIPSGIPQPLCHPRGNPDLVRDDLAFRSWRKDNPDRAMYDSYALFYKKVR